VGACGADSTKGAPLTSLLKVTIYVDLLILRKYVLQTPRREQIAASRLGCGKFNTFVSAET
jgi:hypothetical protein